MPDSDVREFWAEFRAECPRAGPRHAVWVFGDDERLAVELAGLAAAGIKTATACLAWEYEAADEALPAAGGFAVVTTLAGAPLLVLETTEMAVVPFAAVDERFAFDEGEDDRSLAAWRREHWAYFARRCAALGREPSASMPVVCQRFRVVFRARGAPGPI